MDWERLTPSEQEVAQSVALGLSNKMIPRHLGISNETVKKHLMHIFLKLPVESRAALAAAYVAEKERES